MKKLIYIHVWVLLLTLFFVPAVQGQNGDAPRNDSREQPIAPAPAILSSSGTVESALVPEAPSSGIHIAADERPLAGVEEETLRPNFGVHNFIMPRVTAASEIATNSSASGLVRPEFSGYLLGTLELNHVTDRSELILNYTGGGQFSAYLNSAVQDLGLYYSYRWRRWSLLLGEQVGFLSQSPFGFGGVGGLALLNGVTQLNPDGVFVPFLDMFLTPNQTIPTIVAPRLSNTSVAHIEYSLTPRSSWTAAASYGALQFFGAGFINNRNELFQTGYKYLLNPQSSLAILYRFDEFRFTDFHHVVQDHVAQLSYARYVTGRMRFQVGAGPSLVVLRGVITGPQNRITLALNGSVDYRLDRTTVLVSFDHLVNGGSGVLIGAQTTQVEASVERKLSPRWQGSASLGWADNQNIVETPDNFGNGNYNSWYATVRFNRQLQLGSELFFAYGTKLQAKGAKTCITLNCGTTFTGHQFTVGVNFGFHPISLQ